MALRQLNGLLAQCNLNWVAIATLFYLLGGRVEFLDQIFSNPIALGVSVLALIVTALVIYIMFMTEFSRD